MGTSRIRCRLWPAVVAAALLGGAVLASGAQGQSATATSTDSSASESAGWSASATDSAVTAAGDAGPQAGGSDPPDPDSPVGAVVRLFAARSAALAARDRQAWAETVAVPGSDAGRDQLIGYDNLVALGVAELTVSAARSATAAEPSGAAAPSHARTVTVQLGHAIPGYDRAARVATRTVSMVRGADGWRIARDRADSDPLQVWDLAGMRVVRSGSVLVAGNAPAGALAQRLADAEAGQARVRAVLGNTPPAVVVAPATAPEAAAQLNAPGGSGSGQVAATTDGAVGADGTAGADRVILHPDAFARLTGDGARVVLAHELTHVATRATVAGSAPLWLSEGLAEYVAWSTVTMPVETAAARLLAAVRAEGAPAALPPASDFDAANADLATAYQASWIAVRRIAADHGEARLVRFYGAAAQAGTPAGSAVERALRTELGTTTAAFVAGWRADLERLAGR